MPQFYAPAPRGLKEVLKTEFQKIGLKNIENQASGVTFEGPWADCYRANLQSRLAHRILKPLLDFVAYEPEELYGHIQRHDFTKYISPNGLIKVEASISESKLRDQRFVALKTKDAIVDQFRDKYGERPSVDKQNADMIIVVYGKKNQFHVYLDTTGTPLFQRGYRDMTGIAPLKETLAAGLVMLSGWDLQKPIVDPFCGSGTILIEAALMALNMAPGLLRKSFAFERLEGFNSPVYDDLVTELSSQEAEPASPFKLYGFDSDPKMIRIAKQNAKNAGVDHLIEFKTLDVTRLQPPSEQKTGLIITNPPYGQRMGETDALAWVYKDFSHVLKDQFHGWDVWVLSGDPELSKNLALKTDLKHQVFNGNIECRFMRYTIKKGSFDTRVYRKPQG